MTEANLNETINGYSGSIGKLVFKKYKGRTIVARKGVSSKPPTQPQVHHRAEFKEASDFAKTVKVNPDLLAFYEPIAKQRDVTLRVVAMGDYLKKPAIKWMDLDNYKGRIGDVIEIRAEDDLGLAELNVNIVAQDGTPIESGKAVEEGERSGKCIYTATKAVATGTDVFIELRGAEVEMDLEPFPDHIDIPGFDKAALLMPPWIETLLPEFYLRDRHGGEIEGIVHIITSDLFGIASMAVTIKDPAGNLLERGEAMRDETCIGYWVYPPDVTPPAGTSLIVRVVATDALGGLTIAEATLELTDEYLQISTDELKRWIMG